MNVKAVQGFEDRFRQARKENDITLSALQERCEEYFTDETRFSFTTLCNYSRGAGIPSNDKIKVLAEALGVEYRWLKTGKGPMHLWDLEPDLAEEEPVEDASTGREPAKRKHLSRDSGQEEGQETGAEKNAPRKESADPTVILQYGDEDVDISDLVDRCRTAWKAQFKGKDKNIRSFILYVRPEEGKAYWMVNEKDSGTVIL